MYVRNLDHQPVTNTAYVGLQKDENYWFPHWFKYVAWFVVINVIISSSVVLILYGMSFGLIKSYLWITAFASSFFIGIFVTAPIRIFLFSLIDSIFIKRKPVTIKRKILPSLLSNPPNSIKKKQVVKYRQYNASLYTPTPLHKLQSRMEDIKYNLEMRNLTADILAYFTFMIAVFHIVLINKTPMGFYSNKMILELILNGSYTDSISFKEITTYERFLEYLNETLLPALLINRMDINKKSNEFHEKKKRSQDDTPGYEKPPTEAVRIRGILEHFNLLSAIHDEEKSDIFGRSWTLNFNLKLMGKPRLRQVRVKTGTCKELRDLEARNIECAAELTAFNVETRNFSLKWSPYPSKGLTELQALPWSYQSAWQTATMPLFAKFTTYPAGGYVLDLAKNIDDARIVIDFLDAFQWVDVRTRAVFIEFTVYCVNTNLFNVVTLIIEKSATGCIIPSYEIHTAKFIFVENELQFLSVIMSVLFAILLFFFLLRESLRIHRTSFKLYMSRGFAILDLAIVFFGVLSLVFIILRSIYVSFLLKKLEKAANNEFVSFVYAACWYTLSVYIETLLVCLAFFKLFRLLTFRVVFFQFQTVLNHCYQHFIDLVLKQMIVIIAFALFFNLVLLDYSERFRNFGIAFSSIIGLAVALDDTFDFSVLNRSSWFLAPLFFVLFVILISIIFVNMFIAVICLYFHKIRNVTLQNKYNLLEYLRHFLTKNRQKDILHLRGNRVFPREETGFSVMRLKGGGNKPTTKKKITVKPKRENNNERMKAKIQSEDEFKCIMLKDFVIKKTHDTTCYNDLLLSRAEVMKNLTSSFLADDEEIRKIVRENALRALFWSFITDKKKLEDSGEYFFVMNKFTNEVFDQRVLFKMKKVIEEFGKEKCWLVEDAVDEELLWCEQKLSVLEKKLSFLLKKRS